MATTARDLKLQFARWEIEKLEKKKNVATDSKASRFKLISSLFPLHFPSIQSGIGNRSGETERERDLLFTLAERLVEDVRVLLNLPYSDHTFLSTFSLFLCRLIKSNEVRLGKFWSPIDIWTKYFVYYKLFLNYYKISPYNLFT